MSGNNRKRPKGTLLNPGRWSGLGRLRCLGGLLLHRIAEHSTRVTFLNSWTGKGKGISIGMLGSRQLNQRKRMGAGRVSRGTTVPEQLIQRVFDTKTWHGLEIPPVGGEQKGVVDQRGGRNLQVHCAETKFLSAKSLESSGDILLEWHNHELLIELKEPGELPIAGHLTNRRPLLGDHREPTAQRSSTAIMATPTTSDGGRPSADR